MQSLSEWIVGIDLGATYIRIALSKSNGIPEVIEKYRFQKSKSIREEVEQTICKPLEELLNKNDIVAQDVKGIGVATAALFDRDSGDLVSWPNHPLWKGVCLKKILENRFRAPVLLEDDANAAALGEHSMGAAQGYADFAYITISTGIGCGLILGNKLYKGYSGWAGELGHTRIDNCNVQCGCGARGCLQSVASGTALIERFRRYAGQEERYKGITQLSQISALAGKGDVLAKDLFKDCANYIGIAIINLSMLLDLPLVVLGGGVMHEKELLLPHIKKEVEAHISHLHKHIRIETAQLKDSSGVFGVMELVKREGNLYGSKDK